MTSILLIASALMVVGVIVLVLQNVQEGRDDSINEMERYRRQRDRANASSAQVDGRVTEENVHRHINRRRDLDGMEEVRRQRTKRIVLVICLACILGICAGICVSLTNNTRFNSEYFWGGTEQDFNDDGSLKFMREYGLGGICHHEYQDMGDYIRETRYDSGGRISMEVEYEKAGEDGGEGNIRWRRSYENGKLRYEYEYKNGVMVRSTGYQYIGNSKEPSPSYVTTYKEDGTEQSWIGYDSNGKISFESNWVSEFLTETVSYEDGEPSWKTEYQYDENHYLKQQVSYVYDAQQWRVSELELAILLPEEKKIPVGEDAYVDSDQKILWAVGRFYVEFGGQYSLEEVRLLTVGEDADESDYLAEYDQSWDGESEFWAEDPDEYVVEYDSAGQPVSFRYQ